MNSFNNSLTAHGSNDWHSLCVQEPWLYSDRLPKCEDPILSHFLTDPEVFVCDSMSAANPELLKSNNIGYMLSLAKVSGEDTLSDDFFQELGINRRFSFIDDTGVSQDKAIMQAFNIFSEMYLKAQETQKGLIVHCVKGVSRSPCIACAFYALHKNVTFQEAVKFFSQIRNTMIHPLLALNFCSLLKIQFK